VVSVATQHCELLVEHFEGDELKALRYAGFSRLVRA
jgi:hypothetical protein